MLFSSRATPLSIRPRNSTVFGQSAVSGGAPEASGTLPQQIPSQYLFLLLLWLLLFCLFYFWFTWSPIYSFSYPQSAISGGVLEAYETLPLQISSQFLFLLIRFCLFHFWYSLSPTSTFPYCSQLLVVASSKLSELCLWRSFHHSSFSLFVDFFSFCLFYFSFTLSPSHTFPCCQPADTGGVLEASGTLALPGAGIFIIIILQLGFFIIFFYSFRSVPYYLVYFSFIFPSDDSVSQTSFSIVLQILSSCSASDFSLALLERWVRYHLQTILLCFRV